MFRLFDSILRDEVNSLGPFGAELWPYSSFSLILCWPARSTASTSSQCFGTNMSSASSLRVSLTQAVVCNVPPRWIDFLGVVSILLELSWFANLVLPLFMSGAEAEGSQPSIVRIGKAARAGTRAGRMMRLVRMIRLVRIVRLLRFVRRSRSRLSDRAGQRVATQRQALRTTQVIQTATDRSALKRATTARYTCGSELVSACCSVRWRNKQRLRRVDPRREATIAAEQDREEREQASLAHAPRSRVRKRITELIEFKVVIGVIFVLLVLPLLDSLSSSSSATVSGEVELALLDVAHQGDPSSAALVRRQFLELRPDTLELEIDGLAYVSDEARLAELRASEISRLEVGTVSGAFDLSAELREQAIMGFVQTQAIIVLLGVGAGLLSRDVDQLLVQPLERVSRVLRPALPAAIARMGQNFRRWLGRRDGEELSTRLLLAAVESLFADLRPEVEELYRSRERAARFQQGLEAVGKRAGSTRRLRAQRAVVETKESAYAFGSVDDLNASMGTGVRTPGAVGSISGGITPPGLKVFDADTPLTADALDALLSASSRFYVPSDDLYAAIQTGGAEHVHPRRLPGLPMPSAQQVPAKTNLKSAPRPSTIAEDPELPNRSATETGSYSVSMSPSSPIRGSGSTSIPSSAAKDSGRLSEAATEAGRGGERTEHQRSSPADV